MSLIAQVRRFLHTPPLSWLYGSSEITPPPHTTCYDAPVAITSTEQQQQLLQVYFGIVLRPPIEMNDFEREKAVAKLFFSVSPCCGFGVCSTRR